MAEFDSNCTTASTFTCISPPGVQTHRHCRLDLWSAGACGILPQVDQVLLSIDLKSGHLAHQEKPTSWQRQNNLRSLSGSKSYQILLASTSLGWIQLGWGWIPKNPIFAPALHKSTEQGDYPGSRTPSNQTTQLVEVQILQVKKASENDMIMVDPGDSSRDLFGMVKWPF